MDMSPRNWIPKGRHKLLRSNEDSEKVIYHYNPTQKKEFNIEASEKREKLIYHYNPTQEKEFDIEASKKREKSLNQLEVKENSGSECTKSDKKNNREDENTISTNADSEWSDINEVIESDFLISPGDIYPNRKVELQDACVTEETRKTFEEICDKHEEAFSKNNKDIGRTQLIEMEIDTGSSVPLAQSPYTLPLKHYDWVRNEIETLEKAGVIERSLSPWASPVIVVPKKSAVDEPPRRRLCVDY